jgi:transcriptional regulator with XRE-family HTH domain
MNKKLIDYVELISKIKTEDIADLVLVDINMVQKYKRFTNLPRLDKAILIEDTFNIPARAWVELKKYKEDNK